MAVASSGRPRVAIVGAGISGLTAALGLQAVCDTVIFESLERLGGHILPHRVDDPQGRAAAVDTAFVVFVPESYPRLTALLAWLGVEHATAITKFRVTDEPRDLSFDAAELLRLCGKRLPRACRHDLLGLYQVLARIRREGAASSIPNIPLREWLELKRYQPETIELGVLPWVASFWGLQPETVLTVSARVALREIARNAGPNQMHRITPSTQAYLEGLVSALERTEFRHEEVSRVVLEGGPRVETSRGHETFDRVILTVDAPTARALLHDAPRSLLSTLGTIHYEPTVAVLHRDPTYLPRDRAQWRTFHHRRRRDHDRTRSVTTWVLDLLHEWHHDPTQIVHPTLLSTGDPGLVDESQISAEHTIAVFRHRHLVSTPRVVDTVAELARADLGQRFTLAGSYLGVGGLHEAALLSGVRAADKIRQELGLVAARWPWTSME